MLCMHPKIDSSIDSSGVQLAACSTAAHESDQIDRDKTSIGQNCSVPSSSHPFPSLPLPISSNLAPLLPPRPRPWPHRIASHHHTTAHIDTSLSMSRVSPMYNSNSSCDGSIVIINNGDIMVYVSTRAKMKPKKERKKKREKTTESQPHPSRQTNKKGNNEKRKEKIRKRK